MTRLAMSSQDLTSLACSQAFQDFGAGDRPLLLRLLADRERRIEEYQLAKDWRKLRRERERHTALLRLLREIER